MLEHRSKRFAFLVYNYTNRFSSIVEYHFDIENQLFKQLSAVQAPSSDKTAVDNDNEGQKGAKDLNGEEESKYQELEIEEGESHAL